MLAHCGWDGRFEATIAGNVYDNPKLLKIVEPFSNY